MSTPQYSLITELYTHVDLVRIDLPKIFDKKNKEAFNRALQNAEYIIRLSKELKRFIADHKKHLAKDKVAFHATEKELLERLNNENHLST
jgi:hypothetical protein